MFVIASQESEGESRAFHHKYGFPKCVCRVISFFDVCRFRLTCAPILNAHHKSCVFDLRVIQNTGFAKRHRASFVLL